MGFVPPPLVPTVKELKKRIANGTRTMAEIDPEFTEWMLSNPVGWFHKIFKSETYKRLYRPMW